MNQNRWLAAVGAFVMFNALVATVQGSIAPIYTWPISFGMDCAATAILIVIMWLFVYALDGVSK